MDGVLLIHAFPLDARMWEPQLAALSSGVPVVAPHLPGFGGIPGPDEGILTMRAAADRCVEELDRAGIDRAVVCGLSLGGYVAFELLRGNRGRIAGLVLANTRAVQDPEEARGARLALAERLEQEGSGFLVAQPPALLSTGAPGELWDRVRALIAEQPADAIAAVSRGMAERPDSTPDLAGVDVPTLVVTSTGDKLIPPEVSTAMAEGIPGAEVATIRDAGHLSNLEAPGPFNDHLERHLERCGLV